MQFVIDQDTGGQFHWRLVGDDGVELAVSATAFGSRQDARRAAPDVPLRAGSATGAETDPTAGGEVLSNDNATHTRQDAAPAGRDRRSGCRTPDGR